MKKDIIISPDNIPEDNIILPNGFDSLLKKQESKIKLTSSEKEFLKSFAEQYKEYKKEREENNINKYYFGCEYDSVRAAHGTSYYVQHLPTGHTLELGDENIGRLQAINFLSIVKKEAPYYKVSKVLAPLLDYACYDCKNYGTEDHPFNCTVKFNFQKYEDVLRDRGCELFSPVPCKLFELNTARDTLDLDLFQVEDTFTEEWHVSNGFHGWSIWQRKMDEYITRVVAKHLESGKVFFLGNLGCLGHGKDNVNSFLGIITNRYNYKRIGSCFSCEYYTGIDDYCLKNYFMNGRCDDYKKRD